MAIIGKAIYAKKNPYQDSQTWVLKDNLVFQSTTLNQPNFPHGSGSQANFSGYANIDFYCNGVRCSQIQCWDRMADYQYDGSSNMTFLGLGQVYNTEGTPSGWVNQNYKTIIIISGEDILNAEFKKWLEYNATLQTQ